MDINGCRSREQPKKKWIDCVKEDVARNGVSSELTSDRRK